MRANQIKKIALLTGDILLLYVTLWLTLMIRFRSIPDMGAISQHFWPFSILFVFWLAVFFINGLYDISATKNDIDFYNKILRNLLVNYGIATAYFYLLTNKLFSIKPQTVFFIYIGLLTVLFLAWRYWYNTFVQRPTFIKQVLVLGMNDEAKELIEEINKQPHLGFHIHTIVHDGYSKRSEFPEVKVYDSGLDLKKYLTDNKLRTVVTVLDPRTNAQIIQQLFESLALKLQFFDLPSFYEKLTGKIPVTNIGHIWFLENLREGEQGVFEILKRFVDITFAALAIVISLPFIPLIALAIKLESKGPVFFRQIRTGFHGKPFLAIKFRSMVEGAEQDGQPQWAQKNDPRITSFGWFMRKTRVDEIPQLFNILRGEMSFIGPRPERPEFIKKLQEIIPFYNERHLVKPGLTGWAQINFQYGASIQDSLKKLQYDLFYIKNRSLALDVAIMLKTINIVLTGKGQ